MGVTMGQVYCYVKNSIAEPGYLQLALFYLNLIPHTQYPTYNGQFNFSKEAIRRTGTLF